MSTLKRYRHHVTDSAGFVNTRTMVKNNVETMNKLCLIFYHFYRIYGQLSEIEDLLHIIIIIIIILYCILTDLSLVSFACLHNYSLFLYNVHSKQYANCNCV